jgi:hypothetical protein
MDISPALSAIVCRSNLDWITGALCDYSYSSFSCFSTRFIQDRHLKSGFCFRSLADCAFSASRPARVSHSCWRSSSTICGARRRHLKHLPEKQTLGQEALLPPALLAIQSTSQKRRVECYCADPSLRFSVVSWVMPYTCSRTSSRLDPRHSYFEVLPEPTDQPFSSSMFFPFQYPVDFASCPIDVIIFHVLDARKYL